MDGSRDYHTKSERERQIPYDITYMWNLKYDTNEQNLQNRNRLTDIKNRLVVAKGEGRIESLGLADEKSFGVWLHNNVNILNTT